MTTQLLDLVKTYTDLEVEGKSVKIPYSITASVPIPRETYDQGRTSQFIHNGAKGSPAKIKRDVIRTAKRLHFNLESANPTEISQFMLQQGIGIDCSGFVYNILDSYLKSQGDLPLNRRVLKAAGIRGRLEQQLLGFRWVRRCSAETLTSDLNTVKIGAATDIKPGDLIRLTHGQWKHIAIVVEASPTQIIYAHSSEYTKLTGPHLAVIKIHDGNLDLESQRWQELTHDGQNYGRYAYDPSRGDSVRRLKHLAYR